MEPTTKVYFVVEIGGADFYFDKLPEAAAFFEKLASTNAQKMGHLGYGSSAYNYPEGKHRLEMKQETIILYPNRKAAEFAKHNDDKANSTSQE